MPRIHELSVQCKKKCLLRMNKDEQLPQIFSSQGFLAGVTFSISVKIQAFREDFSCTKLLELPSNMASLCTQYFENKASFEFLLF